MIQMCSNDECSCRDVETLSMDYYLANCLFSCFAVGEDMKISSTHSLDITLHYNRPKRIPFACKKRMMDLASLQQDNKHSSNSRFTSHSYWDQQSSLAFDFKVFD